MKNSAKYKAPAAFGRRANDNAAPVNWYRGDFYAWQASLPPEQQEKDWQSLSALFNLAEKVPELADALEWAKDHDIRFFIDHSVQAGGYYTVGTGVVGIAEKSLQNTGFAVGALTHEIRHAWQDYYGLIATTGKTFAGYFMRLAVVEADATAHEELASRQYDLSCRIDFNRAAIKATQRLAAGHISPEMRARMVIRLDEAVKSLTLSTHEPQALWKSFANWYFTRAALYGMSAEKLFGNRMGIPGVLRRDLKAEYAPYKNHPVPMLEGLDVLDEQQLRRLGKGFKGQNYFDVAQRDLLHRNFLSASRAETFFQNTRSGKPDMVVRKIRRRQMLLKRHKGRDILL